MGVFVVIMWKTILFLAVTALLLGVEGQLFQTEDQQKSRSNRVMPMLRKFPARHRAIAETQNDDEEKEENIKETNESGLKSSEEESDEGLGDEISLEDKTTKNVKKESDSQETLSEEDRTKEDSVQSSSIESFRTMRQNRGDSGGSRSKKGGKPNDLVKKDQNDKEI